MGYLEIGSMTMDALKDIDGCVEVQVWREGSETQTQRINEQDADKIIAHLQKVFNKPINNKKDGE